MRVQCFLSTVVALAGTVRAKPIDLARLSKRQTEESSSISEMTFTSTDNAITTATTTENANIPPCETLYVATADDDCGRTAAKFDITLYDEESAYSSNSSKCETVMHRHGICRTLSLTRSASPSALPIETAPPYNSVAFVNGTVTSATGAKNATYLVSKNSTADDAGTRQDDLESFETVLTYTLGKSGATRIVTITATYENEDHTVSTTEDGVVSTSIALDAASSSSVSHELGARRTATTTVSYNIVNAESTDTLSVGGSLESFVSSAQTSTTALPTITEKAKAPSSSLALVPEQTVGYTLIGSSLVLFTTGPEAESSSTAAPPSSSTVSADSKTASSTTGLQAHSTLSASSCSRIVSPPAPTQPGIVSDCEVWHVAISGETCTVVAAQYGIPVDGFMSWNPAVDSTTCSRMLAGYAYCVAICESNDESNAAGKIEARSWVPSLDQFRTAFAPASMATNLRPSNSRAGQVYKAFRGTGSVADGWPTMDQWWSSFEEMFQANLPIIQNGCAEFNVEKNSPREIDTLKATILSVAADTKGMDARFILAEVLQESFGCVRVPTTHWDHANPGLMQTHMGLGSCNTNMLEQGIAVSTDVSKIQNPCPDDTIELMIRDGVLGTAAGDGVSQIFSKETGARDAMTYYRTAKRYNGGSIGEGGVLEMGCCTPSYASDIANRLIGWVESKTTPRVWW